MTLDSFSELITSQTYVLLTILPILDARKICLVGEIRLCLLQAEKPRPLAELRQVSTVNQMAYRPANYADATANCHIVPEQLRV